MNKKQNQQIQHELYYHPLLVLEQLSNNKDLFSNGTILDSNRAKINICIQKILNKLPRFP